MFELRSDEDGNAIVIQDLESFLMFPIPEVLCLEINGEISLQWHSLDLEDRIEKVRSSLFEMGFSGGKITSALNEVTSKSNSIADKSHEELLIMCCYSILNVEGGEKFHAVDCDDQTAHIDSIVIPSTDINKRNRRVLIEEEEMQSTSYIDNNCPTMSSESEAGVVSRRDYRRLLAKLRREDCLELAQYIKDFVASVVLPGSNFSCTFVDSQLSAAWQRFLLIMERAMRCHRVWECESVESQDHLISTSLNALEEYVMRKIHKVALKCLGEIVNEDVYLLRKIKLLSFVQPRHLDIHVNDIVINLAGDELKKINSVVTPACKLECVVKSCDLLFNFLNLQRDMCSRQRAGGKHFLSALHFLTV